MQGTCWFCCPSFCSRKERASGLCFGKCTSVHNKHLSFWASEHDWLGLTYCAGTSHKHILHQLSASVSCPEAPSAGFFLCCFCFSFSAVHFCLPPHFQVKKLPYISAQRPPFCSYFFSFVHIPQYHQDDVKHLISSLFFLT